MDNDPRALLARAPEMSTILMYVGVNKMIYFRRNRWEDIDISVLKLKHIHINILGNRLPPCAKGEQVYTSQ